ncbi:hypothetical protein ACFLVE_02745 [Chloroflexota bacterium]
MSDRIRSLDDFLALLKSVKRERESQYKALCPGHNDREPSLSIKEADGKILLKCFSGCELADILKPLNLEARDLFLNSHKSKPKHREIEAVYHYDGFEVVRTRPKGFYQRRPDGKGGYVNNLKGITPTLYHQSELKQATDSGKATYIAEGEKDVDRLRTEGFIATCNPMGAGKWRDRYSQALISADVVIIPDKDGPGHDHAAEVARSCYGKAARIRMLELPDANDVSEWLNNGHTAAELTQLTSQAPEYKPAQLEQILERCRHWFFMPDTGSLEVVLGAIAANKLPGDPVWLLLVGTPGSGKTEVLNTVVKVGDIHQVAILTEASLLSGTPRRDAEGAKGGLLREVGAFGILVIKDFGGVLSVSRESRGPILAGLREVYDGAWTRYVGSDGGRTLAWAGKCGLVGGATPSIDGFYAVMSILGERFTYYRLPETSEDSKAEKALIHAGHEAEMRAELAGMVADFFNTLDISKSVDFTTEERDKLIHLAVFTTRCRSAVERDSYVNREITLIPGVESPTRLVKVLAQLLRGLQVVGIAKERAWELVQKAALDSMPAIRQKVVLAMLETDVDTVTSDLAKRLGYPTNTTRRALEDLTCYGVIKREPQGEGRADLWSLTDWTRKTYQAATSTLPQILKGEYHTLYNKYSNIEVSICGKPAGEQSPDPRYCQGCYEGDE